MITPDTPLIYDIDRLLTIFTAARDNKQARVDALNIGKPGGMGTWAAGYPDGNTHIEQQVVDALQGWKDAGAKTVVTARLLSDVDVTQPHAPTLGGDVHDSFFIQLKKNEIQPVPARTSGLVL